METMSRRPMSVRVDAEDLERLEALVDALPMPMKLGDVKRAAIRVGIHRLETMGLHALDELAESPPRKRRKKRGRA